MRDALDRRTARWLIAALLTGLFVVGLAGPVGAQQGVSHQTLTVTSGTAASLATTTTNPNAGPVTFCVGTVEGSALRFWVDGSAPGPGSGHYVSAGGTFVLPSFLIAQSFSMTPDAPATGVSTAQVSCFKGGTPAGLTMGFDPSLAKVPTTNVTPVNPPLPLPACNALVRTNCK